MGIVQQIFSNMMYLTGISSIVAIIILLLRKIFDKKISPKWKLAMWGLLLISLIIPFRITLYANNQEFYTFSTIIDKLEKLRNLLATNQLGKILTTIWIIGIAILILIYLINSILMRKQLGKEEIKEERILKILEKAKKEIGVKQNIKLIKQNSKITPCIYGIIHPKILLTRRNFRKTKRGFRACFYA